MNGNTPGETILSKNAEFDGKLHSTDPVRVDGKLKGEVRSEATITVGESGVVDGNLSAKNIITAGKVKGGIKAAEKVELKGTSRLEGDLVTVRLVIEDGAQFEGMCSMGGKGGGPVQAQPQQQQSGGQKESFQKPGQHQR